MKTEINGQKTGAIKHAHKLLTGSTNDKYPVILDGGKTIIYISDKSKEAETRLKYKLRGQNNQKV